MINYDWLKTTTSYGMTTSKEDKINYYKIMGKTDIEWTDRSWNPTVGCSKVSQGCKNCYAMGMSARIANSAFARKKKGKELTDVEKAYMAIVKWEKVEESGSDSDIKALPKWNNEIAVIDSRLEEPLQIQKPQRFFVNSMTDLFHPKIEFSLIDKIFAVMALAEQHQFQILTKRPEIMKEYLNDGHRPSYIREQMIEISGEYIDWINWPIKNVWLGTSVENQKAAKERIPELLSCPAHVRFLSCEPLLGPLDIEWFFSDEALFKTQGHYKWIRGGPGIHQCIVGGESGHNARPMLYEWVKSIQEQCEDWNVPFFFKQWGKYRPANQPAPLNEIKPDAKGESLTEYGRDSDFEIKVVNGKQYPFAADGKKANGALLDGEHYREFPKI